MRRLEAEVARLTGEVALLKGIIRSAGDIIVTTDREGLITEFNEGAEAILGYRKAEVLGTPARSLYVTPADRDRLARKALSTTGSADPEEVAVRRKDGNKVWLSLTLTPLKAEDGAILGTVGVGKDVTQRKHLEEELRRLSITDGLTGLYNQTRFFESLEVEKERAIRLEHPLSLVLFDLDGFKEYNDKYGHQAGDEVLRQVATVIFRSIRKEVDQGFRYGGDEFTITTPGADGERALRFAERVRAQISNLGFEGISASVGVSTFVPDDPRRQLVSEADEAMYASKRAGGGRTTLWRSGLVSQAALAGGGPQGERPPEEPR